MCKWVCTVGWRVNTMYMYNTGGQGVNTMYMYSTGGQGVKTMFFFVLFFFFFLLNRLLLFKLYNQLGVCEYKMSDDSHQ